MATTVGSNKKGPFGEMNVTPLIDVLLVLLIIFMLITPLTPKGLEALVPNRRVPPKPEPRGTIVLSLDAYGNLKINQERCALEALGPRLEGIYKTRHDRVIFVTSDPSLAFDDVAKVIDLAKGAGIDKIGLLTKAVEEK